ncbi:MAG: efflux RND transporter periplasmic adaptor subunit [Candidatus Binataceae bacterium]|nr:efflux RND transporter periplasmic adaptor subunit [Candidatus Binataceae bacterium]
MRRLRTALAVLLITAGCGHQVQNESGPKIPVVAVAYPQRGAAIRSISLPGDLVGLYEATLYAKVTGYLKTLSVDKGDWIRTGQELAVIEVPELKESLRRARASLEINKVTYDRLDRVWKEDPRLVAREDVDVAFAKYQESSALADQLKAMMAYTRIIAPFDGVVTGRFVDPGALINAGSSSASMPFSSSSSQGSSHPGGNATPVIAVAQIDRMRTYIYVPQENVKAIHRGLSATVTVQNIPGKAFKGEVTRYANALSFSTRTMLTEIDLDNPGHALYPGMYAQVTLELEHHPNALELPDSAILRQRGEAFVFVVNGGRLKRVPVTVGIVSAHYVEIVAGLRGDEAVVSNINPNLTPDEEVTAVKIAPLQWDPPKAAAPIKETR